DAQKPYTASVWLRPTDADARPGIQGWAELSDGNTLSVIAERIGADWSASSSGPVEILSSGVIEETGEWSRYSFTFSVTTSESPVSLFFGLAPDNRHIANTSADYAGFQLEPGETATDYVPGSAVRGISLGAGRLPFWRTALSGFVEAPLFGQAENFSDYYADQGRFRSRIQELPAHPHNQYLDTLYHGGLTGSLSFVVFLLALAWPAFNRHDYS